MSAQRNSGLGFFGALSLLFIGLKLGSVIDWSWWLVLSPIWGPSALAIVIVICWVIGELASKKA